MFGTITFLFPGPGMHDQSIDFLINVRPQYLQDGGKAADVYTHPPGLRDTLQVWFCKPPARRMVTSATPSAAADRPGVMCTFSRRITRRMLWAPSPYTVFGDRSAL